jgi:hypothetical protein
MLKALQEFNRRLEALALEVTGLRTIVNIQSKQLAAVEVVRPMPRFTTSSSHRTSSSRAASRRQVP